MTFFAAKHGEENDDRGSVMIAIARPALRVLALGLNREESLFLEKTYAGRENEIYAADSDIGLWDAARNQRFDVCLLGQSESLPHPTLRIWLMRALQPHARIAVLYDEIGPVETDPIPDSGLVEVVQRPASGKWMQSILGRDEPVLPSSEDDLLPSLDSHLLKSPFE